MSLVQNQKSADTFDEEQIKNLRKTNLLELPSDIFRLICESLDSYSKWRDVVALADASRYALSALEVERCAGVIHSNYNASPTKRLLEKWGNRGMIGEQLAIFLKALQIERPLKNFKLPEKLVVTVQPISSLVAVEGGSLELYCEATSFPYPVYEWFKERKMIRTAVSNTGRLVISNVTAAAAGSYTCRIHCIDHTTGKTDCEFTRWCSVEFQAQPKGPERNMVVHDTQPSISKTPVQYDDLVLPDIQVPAKPQLLRQPVNLSVGIGGDAVFVVETDFITKLSYQWLHNNESVPNAVGPELRFMVDDSSCEGMYQCLVTNEFGDSILSKPAKLSITSGAVVHKAADKLALLIGVSMYKSHGIPLPAVKNDLQETVKVLESMQFKVVSLLDLTLDEMHDAIDMFCELLSADVYTVFYCAGHGFIGNNRRHYLIPWDAHPDVSPSDCICIESIQDKIQQKKPKLMMFCLDICRRRILSDSYVEVEPVDHLAKSVPNRIILYAASEGQQAFEQSKKCSDKPRGVFNQYLLEVIHKSSTAIDVYKALMDKFQTSPYRNSPNYRESFQQNPEMQINCEDYNRSLHDPLDTKCFRDKINEQTALWHRVHRLPVDGELQLGDKVGTVSVSYTRITSNVMRISITMKLAFGWTGKVCVDIDSVPLALRPLETIVDEIDKSTSCTVFCLENLQRLREDLQIMLLFELSRGSSSHPFRAMLPLGRPLIAFAYSHRTTTLPVTLLSGTQTERKEAMEHTEDSSLSSDI